MIKGLGVDIVDMERIERLLERYGDSFVQKVYTPREQECCRGMAKPAVHFAGRFAVKEAFYKALPASCQPRSAWKSNPTSASTSRNISSVGSRLNP